MTTNPHKSAALGQIHSPVNWSFSTASARRAVGAYVTTDLGGESMQTDTSPPTFWKLAAISGSGSSVTPTWIQITTAADNTGTPLTLITSVPVTAWLRADLGVTIGTGVSAWVDQTSNAWSFAQATGANQPTRNASDSTLGNQATITGDGSNDQLLSSGIVVPAAFWMCLVLKQVTWSASGSRITDSPASPTRASVQTNTSSPSLLLVEQSSFTAVNNGAAVGAWKRITAQESNATSDGLLIGTTFTGGTALGRTAASNQLSLFAAFSGSACANVAIAEVILTNGIPNSGEKTAIDSYLLARYGLSSLFT